MAFCLPENNQLIKSIATKDKNPNLVFDWDCIFNSMTCAPFQEPYWKWTIQEHVGSSIETFFSEVLI